MTRTEPATTRQHRPRPPGRRPAAADHQRRAHRSTAAQARSPTWDSAHQEGPTRGLAPASVPPGLVVHRRVAAGPAPPGAAEARTETAPRPRTTLVPVMVALVATSAITLPFVAHDAYHVKHKRHSRHCA